MDKKFELTFLLHFCRGILCLPVGEVIEKWSENDE